MDAVFAGKYGFQTTNTSGPLSYLTLGVGEGGYIPELTAPALTAAQRALLYVTSPGDYLVAMLAPGPTAGSYDTAWCADEPQLQMLVAYADADQAQPVAIASLTAGTSGWSIQDTTSATWEPLAYVPSAVPPCLVYASLQVKGMLSTLTCELVTPGYAAITNSGCAPENSDFTYADLSGLDFGGVDLTGADFTNANLTSTDFTGATLINAKFDGLTLEATVLSGATLTNASFQGTDLTAVVWGTGGVAARGADFSGAFMAGCAIGSSTTQGAMNDAIFTGADLSRSDLSNIDLSSTTLHGANLTGANLSMSTLTAAQLGGSTGQVPATLCFAVMQNVTLDEADLFAVDFCYATVNGAETSMNEAATLQQANFANAYMEGISLRNSNLQGAILDGACLVAVDFTGANLAAATAGAPASLASTCLQGAVFTGATLGGANLANAAISFAPGTLEVRYCTALGLDPPYPLRQPLSYNAATTLAATTLAPETVCPNGATFAANTAAGLSLETMLTAPGAPHAWLARTCLSGPGASD